MKTSFSPPKGIVPTQAKREFRWGERFATLGGWERATAIGRQKRRLTVPGVDVAALQAKCGPETAHLPQVFRATFRCPVDASVSVYEETRKRSLEIFLAQMGKQKWEPVVDGQHRPRVYPGVYPAYIPDNIGGRLALLDQREYIIEMWFHQERPKLIRFEIPPSAAEEYVISP